MNRLRFLAALPILFVILLPLAKGQTPAPIVVQAANASPAAPETAKQPAPAPTDSNIAGAIKLLEELKAANAETLKKQRAVLEQLDDLQKAADQLKIFANRG